MATSVTRQFTFAAAHRIEDHPKCGRLHGHNYDISVSIVAENFVPLEVNGGMLIDYGVMDSILKPIIDQMDHRYLVSRSNIRQSDPYALLAASNGDAYLLNEVASTAECIAEHLYTKCLEPITEALPEGLVFTMLVRVDESKKSSAMYSED